MTAAVRGTGTAIIRADARALPLADASVDLIVTSPPYWGIRSYQDGGEHYGGQIGAETTPSEYIEALIECTREWMRVLKPSGSIWVNLGDTFARKSLMGLPWRYALRCTDELSLTLRAEVIWAKTNGLPESVKDRVRRSHEQWFHFTLSPAYFSSLDDIRESVLHPRWSRPNVTNAAAVTARRAVGRTSALRNVYTPSTEGRIPGSVWEVVLQPFMPPANLGIDHFAAFPMALPRRIILGWCPSSGTVLDPFGGTGTVALVASMLGRKGITVDASGDYCRLAQWRCSDPVERAKAALVEPDRRPVDPGQTDLFGATS